jgi:hypothetical protein
MHLVMASLDAYSLFIYLSGEPGKSVPQPGFKLVPPKYMSVALHLDQLRWKSAGEVQKFGHLGHNCGYIMK